MKLAQNLLNILIFLGLSWWVLGCAGNSVSPWNTVYREGPLTVSHAYIDEGSSTRSIYHVISTEKNFSRLRLVSYHWCNYEVKKETITITPSQLGQKIESQRRFRLIDYDSARWCGRPSHILVYGLNNMAVAEKTKRDSSYVKGMYIRSKRGKREVAELDRQLQQKAQAEIRRTRGFIEKLDKVKAKSNEIVRRNNLSERERFCEDNPVICNPALAKSATRSKKDKTKKTAKNSSKGTSSISRKVKKTLYSFIVCHGLENNKHVSNVFSYVRKTSGYSPEEVREQQKRIKNTLPRAEKKVGLPEGSCFWSVGGDEDKSMVSAKRRETLREFAASKKIKISHFNIQW